MKLSNDLQDLLQDLKSLDERYDTEVFATFFSQLHQGLEDELEPEELQELLKDSQQYMEMEEILQDDEQRRVVADIINRLPGLLGL